MKEILWQDDYLCNPELYDIGIYCINAARYILQAEPVKPSPGAP